MLVEQLCREVETYAARMRLSHPLMLRARKGELPPAAVATYLSNVRYSILNIYRQLQVARVRADELGFEPLAAFLEHKFREEYGHDKWAEQDLRRMREDFHAEPEAPSPSTVELMVYLDAVIERDPRCYLAYMFFLEYLTILAGPDFVTVIESHCGIPASHLSVVTHHIELDQHHVTEALSELAQLSEGADRELFSETLTRSMDCFERSCGEVSRIAA